MIIYHYLKHKPIHKYRIFISNLPNALNLKSAKLYTNKCAYIPFYNPKQFLLFHADMHNIPEKVIYNLFIHSGLHPG